MARGLRITFPGAGQDFTSFDLTTTGASATYPFSIGVGFKKGDAPENVTTDLATAQVVVKRRWNDGSVKHAIISGRAALSQSVARTINISTGSQSSGTALTAADIETAAPTASVAFDSIGSPSWNTVSLASLLASPVRTWISGPEMVECHYRADVGAGTLLSVWFHVRLFADGRIWIRVIVENGYLDNGAGAVAANADRTYGVTISVGGSPVYSNTGSPGIAHYRNTRYSAEGWIGGDPQITPQHDVAYLRASKLVPNYWWRNPSAATLNALTQTYTQMGRGDLTATMGQGGDQPGIAVLPKWNALYTVGGDARGYRSTLANSSHLNSYGIVWRDKTTNLVAKPSAFSTWAPGGPNSAGATFDVVRGSLTWELNHVYGEGYFAYLVTGDYWHYETLLMNAGLVWLCAGNGTVGITPRGNGTSRVIAAEVRGNAWGMRCIAQLAGIYPSGDEIGDEFQTVLQSNITHWKGIADSAPNQLGYVYAYRATGNIGHAVDNSGYAAIWMYNFWPMGLGFGYDIEPLASMTNYASLLSFLYQGIVGSLGDSNGYCYAYAGAHNIKIAPANNGTVDPTVMFDTWAEVFDQTYGSSPPVPCGAALINVEDNEDGDPIPMTGGSGDPAGDSVMRWDEVLPAIAYAHDHGATGAEAAWNRLVGASNWPTFRDRAAGLDQHPQWGIVPRGWAT